MSWAKPGPGARVVIPADYVNKSSGVRPGAGNGKWDLWEMGGGYVSALFFFSLHNFFINLNSTRAAWIVLFP